MYQSNSKIFQEKTRLIIPWPANSADLNLIENIWSILDDKLLKYNINNTEQLLIKDHAYRYAIHEFVENTLMAEKAY